MFMIEVTILRISDVIHVLKRGVKMYLLNYTFYINMILILNIFFVYRLLLIFTLNRAIKSKTGTL